MMDLSDKTLEKIAMALYAWIKSVEDKNIKIRGQVKRLKDISTEEAREIRGVLLGVAIKEVMDAQEISEGGAGGTTGAGV